MFDYDALTVVVGVGAFAVGALLFGLVTARRWKREETKREQLGLGAGWERARRE